MTPQRGWGTTILVAILLTASARPLAKAFGKRMEWKNLPVLFTPGAGETVLPKAVLESRTLLQRAGATEFALSPEILADAMMSQRMTEGLYPLRLQTQTALRIVGIQDPIPKNCSLKTRGTDVQLLVCP